MGIEICTLREETKPLQQRDFLEIERALREGFTLQASLYVTTNFFREVKLIDKKGQDKGYARHITLPKALEILSISPYFPLPLNHNAFEQMYSGIHVYPADTLDKWISEGNKLEAKASEKGIELKALSKNQTLITSAEDEGLVGAYILLSYLLTDKDFERARKG